MCPVPVNAHIRTLLHPETQTSLRWSAHSFPISNPFLYRKDPNPVPLQKCSRHDNISLPPGHQPHAHCLLTFLMDPSVASYQLCRYLLLILVISLLQNYLFFLIYFIFKLYKIVLVLPNIKMNPPQVYMSFCKYKSVHATFPLNILHWLSIVLC